MHSYYLYESSHTNNRQKMKNVGKTNHEGVIRMIKYKKLEVKMTPKVFMQGMRM